AVQGYFELLGELGTPLLEDYRAAAWEAEAVRRALESSPAPLAPCHNDPWPGNFLEADGRIRIIDWEYSGMNDPMWDLGDLSVEAGLGPAQDRMMMEAYHGGAAPPAIYSRLELYKVMSDLHWSLWGLVQHAHGNPAEDFQTYALGRLANCTARLGSADFGRHLSVVRAGYLARAPKRAYRVQLRAESPDPRDSGERVASRAS
ncbi:MAG: phosphotransferase, partial [Rubrobacter sp.]|nr:phosphotransferase [Rubrobacter sp.]